MTLLFACVFVLLHASAIFFLPAHAMQVSYAFLLAAPLIAAAAALRRGLRGGWRAGRGWLLMALGMASWALGMAASLRQDLFLDNANAAPGDSTLLFVLYGVPIVLAISAPYVEGESPLVRTIDAMLALALGYLFYVHVFSVVTLHGAGSREQAEYMVRMLDAENLFVLLASAIRFSASDRRHEFQFYRAVVTFAGLYTVTTAYYNHFVALGDHPDFGSLRDPLVDVPFLAFALTAWRESARTPRRPSPALVRMVRSGSPLLMALALLALSIVVLQERFYVGVAGVVVAVLGYGTRNTLTQVQHIKNEEGLRRQSDELATMAHTDSLTGLPNRRALDEALERAWYRPGVIRDRITLLMIDIDYFKQLNDTYGHPAGDACLKKIAEALQQVLGRPGDMLGRYGGEEFAVVMTGAPLQAGLVVAERLRQTVEALAIENSGSPHGVVTISVGVSSSMAGLRPLDLLVAQADSALYQAKRNGRNRMAAIDD
ncbi:GGDEF domain-containing protein [Dyella lutea]|uniref:diguanylate cyclase n=1 Tax=Dyella lutea TaxID=2950441 RepID=A0ABT1FEA7_9GAMM|nr:diguanylate cyclase [Dyella lutea]MCP1375654.1 GGDEF domain-containing protein [Dyella lutea]